MKNNLLSFFALILFFTLDLSDANAASDFTACLKANNRYVTFNTTNAHLELSGTSCGTQQRFRFVSDTGDEIVDGSRVIIGYPPANFSWWRPTFNGFVNSEVSANYPPAFVLDRAFPRPWGPGTEIGPGVFVYIRESLEYEAKAVRHRLNAGDRLRWGINLENEEARTNWVPGAIGDF